MDSKKLNSLISTIGKNAGKLREDIQQALIGCAFHAQMHRNTDPFNRLFEVVGSGTRLEGMLKWASLYAPVHFKEEKVILSDKRQKEALITAAECLAALQQAEKWYALATPEKVSNPWDSGDFAKKVMEQLVKQAEKALKNGDADLANIIKLAKIGMEKELEKYEVKEV